MLQLSKKLFTFILGLFFIFPVTVNASHADAEFLTNVAKQYMLAQFPANSGDKKYVVKVSKIDPNRNYGGKCTGYLTAELQNSEIKKSIKNTAEAMNGMDNTSLFAFLLSSLPPSQFPMMEKIPYTNNVIVRSNLTMWVTP